MPAHFLAAGLGHLHVLVSRRMPAAGGEPLLPARRPITLASVYLISSIGAFASMLPVARKHRRSPSLPPWWCMTDPGDAGSIASWMPHCGIISAADHRRTPPCCEAPHLTDPFFSLSVSCKAPQWWLSCLCLETDPPHHEELRPKLSLLQLRHHHPCETMLTPLLA